MRLSAAESLASLIDDRLVDGPYLPGLRRYLPTTFTDGIRV